MMPHELIYTSAPRGLKPGATGYCTVAHTPDLPKDLAEQLEGISHYRHLHVGADPSRSGNPVAFAHSILTTGYTVHHVVSRIADSGLDHSGRSNFLAHHVVFDPDRLPDAGPAWLCEQRFFVQKWDRPASMIPDDRAIPFGHSEPRPCRKWEQLTGDAGWGGVLAAATNAAEPGYLIYEPGQDVLGLLVESMALLPSESRWNVTFNTYFTGKAVRTTCQWRCVTSDSAEAKEALSMRRGAVLRIDREMTGTPSGPLVDAARTGQVELPVPKRRPVPVSVRTSRPVEAADDLPEPEPVPTIPASRPIRTRPVEPMTQPDESNYDIPLPPPSRHAPGKSPVGPLLLGIVLGGLLILAFTSLVELAAGKSIMGFLGVKSAEYEAAKKEQERLEGELSGKIAELDKERKSADSAKSDLRRQIQDRERELATVQKNLDAARKELTEFKDKPAPVSNEGGFFLSTRDMVHSLLRQHALKEAQTKVVGLEKEIAALKGKLAAAGNVAVLPALPILRLERRVDGQKAADLFQIKVGENAKPQLEIIGLPPSLAGTVSAQGDAILLKSTDGLSKATIQIADGTVRFKDGENFEKYPYLGAAIVKVIPGDGSPAAYRQLFWPEVVKDPGTAAGREAMGQTRKYVWEYASRCTESLKKEIENHRESKQLTARNVRIGIGGKNYDLDEVSADLMTAKNRPSPGEPALELTVEGGKLVVDANFPAGAAPPNSCDILSLEIIRVIPDDGRGFKTYYQELFRLLPKK